MSLLNALESGDRLQALVALRGVLGLNISKAEPKEVAALSRQLTIVLEEIERLAPPVKKGSPLDELASRRSADGTSSARSARH